MARRLPKILGRKHPPDESVKDRVGRLFEVYEYYDAYELDENGCFDVVASNNILAPKLALELLPGFQEAKPRRRPKKDRSSLIEDVERVRKEKNCGISHACNTVKTRDNNKEKSDRSYEGIDDVRSVYYRELKKRKLDS